jgi:hypothetical protein
MSALQRRGGEPAIAQIRGELVALDITNEHARNALLQRLGHVRRIDAREVLGRERLHHGRHLVAVEADAGHWRGGDNLECGNWGAGAGGAETRAAGAVRVGMAERAARLTGAGRGAVTVTSGSVSATCPQAASGNINAPITKVWNRGRSRA